MIRKTLKYFLLLFCVPAAIFIGTRVFKDKQYAFISITIAILSCVGFFLTFEKKKSSTRKLILISVMTALSVGGRFLFTLVPGFKPVTAFVVITAIHFGSEAGFLCGSFSALISNMYFGQGPWTPFQMLTWGMIGFVAGIFSKKLKTNRLLLYLYGAFAGVVYSLLMDVWSVLWIDNTFNAALYLV
ncbi:MAG TPA: ECF transporter S component, partial [Clostridiales bacterium]|nr:ECF transporter S component [Clostridiales bacterium]